MRRPQSILPALLLAACAWGAAPAARAGDLYVSGQLAIAAGTADSGGTIDIDNDGTPDFNNSGDDVDSSPVGGGAIGFEFPLSEMVPADWDWTLPEYAVRIETQALGGRDYELITDGPEDYLSKVSSWSVMNNLWLDFPVHEPVSWLLGRVPILEPMTFSAGAGIGVGGTEIDSRNIFRGDLEEFHFTWQAGAEFGYWLTERVSVGLGYRYVSLGNFDVKLDNGPVRVGTLELDLASHEVSFGIRIRFFRVPSPGDWGPRAPR